MMWKSDIILDSSTNDACDSVFDVLDLNEDSMLSFNEAIKIINHLTMDVSLLKLDHDQINCDMCLVFSKTEKMEIITITLNCNYRNYI